MRVVSTPRAHPSLNAMLLCDHTIREAGTGKVSLIGIFENISAARFPVVHRSLSVYTLRATFADRMTPGEIIFALENLGLDRPGRYEFRLHANDRFVAGKSFVVVQTAPAPAS